MAENDSPQNAVSPTSPSNPTPSIGGSVLEQKAPKYDFAKWMEDGIGLDDKRRDYKQGSVDQNEPFFLFIAGSTPAALVGQSETKFVVTWLNVDDTSRMMVESKLAFFLKRRKSLAQRRMGRWHYMLYTSTATSSNFYGRIHVQYGEPPQTMDQALQVWLRRTGKASPETT